MHTLLCAHCLNPKKALPKVPTTAPRLDDVLLAVYLGSLITITNDLCASYDILRPESCGIPLFILWKAFIELLRNVLIPVADLNVTHPDIRPGHDETSNILYKVEKEDNVLSATTKIKINFGSMLGFEDWIAPYGSKFLYIRRRDDWKAKTFLWWQSVAVAAHGSSECPNKQWQPSV